MTGLDHSLVLADSRVNDDPRWIHVRWSGDLFDEMTRSVGGTLHVDVVVIGRRRIEGSGE